MTAVIEQLRPELTTLPRNMRDLQVYRGYPVPFFVARIDGVLEFRVADGAKYARAIRARLCWACGKKLGPCMTYLIGPMCGVNRVTSEPPCHLDCAQFSAKNCPFLARPHMDRREGGLEELGTSHPGFMIRRNPGAVILWIASRPGRLFDDGTGGQLIQLPDPDRIECYAEGKRATRAQVLASVESGLPILLAEAQRQPGAVAELERMRVAFLKLLPADRPEGREDLPR